MLLLRHFVTFYLANLLLLLGFGLLRGQAFSAIVAQRVYWTVPAAVSFFGLALAVALTWFARRTFPNRRKTILASFLVSSLLLIVIMVRVSFF